MSLVYYAIEKDVLGGPVTQTELLVLLFKHCGGRLSTKVARSCLGLGDVVEVEVGGHREEVAVVVVEEEVRESTHAASM